MISLISRTLRSEGRSLFTPPSSLISIRHYKVLSIETSCDDTCVALLDRDPISDKVEVLSHVKRTLNSYGDGGIIPTKAFDNHQRQIASVTKEVLQQNGITSLNPPDLICVTRGPGMKGSLTIGLDFAKGLSVAFDKPLVGVHHMLGHLLIPRLDRNIDVQYPFLSLLISGGHTMLVLSESIFKHEILCDTIDVACGDALDKVAREVGMEGETNLGREMDLFLKDIDSFKGNQDLPQYSFDMPLPLMNKRGRVNQLNFAFGAFQGRVQEIKKANPELINDLNFRKQLAYQAQCAIFNHITNKLKLTLELNKDKLSQVTHFVASGGVASNLTLRQTLTDTLLENSNITKTHYPPVELCTDNAVMIGWAGIEMYESGEHLTTELGVCPIGKWPISEILDVDGWIRK
ncbi:hypothetical protein WICPIJ_002558 [Wickerhamomyces pijperi]|uniref:N(6)-L-threonylcarbamoyladenine synthase n=1 Tax=Wickerhamomyces pijperi TaxID=599730 RepID=A0A9P8Q9K9_WICPI|nr:hypothetical protein WICPIJ_002558 [Wickerhamomyces pijperi]